MYIWKPWDSQILVIPASHPTGKHLVENPVGESAYFGENTRKVSSPTADSVGDDSNEDSILVHCRSSAISCNMFMCLLDNFFSFIPTLTSISSALTGTEHSRLCPHSVQIGAPIYAYHRQNCGAQVVGQRTILFQSAPTSNKDISGNRRKRSGPRRR